MQCAPRDAEMAGAAKRSWTHIVSFAAVIALCVYVIRDIEYPRLGFIRVTATDQVNDTQISLSLFPRGGNLFEAAAK
jgi:hypothetical protein